jgi:hypothetical protein
MRKSVKLFVLALFASATFSAFAAGDLGCYYRCGAKGLEWPDCQYICG